RMVRSLLALCCYVSFFFQAEDGIRDPLVTGVQTCALPIWQVAHRRHAVMASPSCLRRNNRARCTRVFTLGRLRPRTSAISGFDKIGRASCRERVEDGVGGG